MQFGINFIFFLSPPSAVKVPSVWPCSLNNFIYKQQ